MSINNLFQPNEYTVFVGTELATNVIDSNPGNALLIGPVNATAVIISHAGSPTTINDALTVSGTLTANANAVVVGNILCDNYASRTGISMSVGLNAGGLSLGPITGPIRIDQGVANVVDTIVIGNTNATSIAIGRAGINTDVEGTLTFNSIVNPFASPISLYEEFSGVFPSIGAWIDPNGFALQVARLNNVVTMTWQWLPGFVTTIANDAIRMNQFLPPQFRPVHMKWGQACVYNNAADLNHPVVGFVSITSAGIVQFATPTGTPPSPGLWPNATANSGVASGSVQWSIN